LELDNTSCASTSNNVDDDDSHYISDFGAGATYLETDKTPAEASTFDAWAHFDLIEHFSNVMNDFVCQMQAKSSVNIKLVDETVAMIKTLVSSLVEPICEMLKKSVNGSSSTINSLIEMLPKLVDTVDCYLSEHKRLKILTDSGVYIEPREHVVGVREESKFTSRVGFPVNNNVEDKMYYIPLDFLLSAICRSPRVRGLLQQQLPSSGTDGIIRHLADGELMKMHPLFEKHPDALILHLYVDTYETTNPLGSWEVTLGFTRWKLST
jgi:hypothetical protein